jgi:hypothetical protein
LELIDEPERLVIAGTTFTPCDLARRWKSLERRLNDPSLRVIVYDGDTDHPVARLGVDDMRGRRRL